MIAANHPALFASVLRPPVHHGTRVARGRRQRHRAPHPARLQATHPSSKPPCCCTVRCAQGGQRGTPASSAGSRWPSAPPRSIPASRATLRRHPYAPQSARQVHGVLTTNVHSSRATRRCRPQSRATSTANYQPGTRYRDGLRRTMARLCASTGSSSATVSTSARCARQTGEMREAGRLSVDAAGVGGGAAARDGTLRGDESGRRREA